MVKVAKCVTPNKVNFTCYLLGLVISEIVIGNIVLKMVKLSHLLVQCIGLCFGLFGSL